MKCDVLCGGADSDEGGRTGSNSLEDGTARRGSTPIHLCTRYTISGWTDGARCIPMPLCTRNTMSGTDRVYGASCMRRR
eukprot:3335599-Rhodomonas_salina.2